MARCAYCLARDEKAYDKKRTRTAEQVERQRANIREWHRLKRKYDPDYREKSITTLRDWWDALPPEEKYLRQRRKQLMRLYGLTLEQCEELVAKHHGRCAICGVMPEKKNLLHIDHDHATGRIRGMLCLRCNTALGRYGTVRGYEEMALTYLKETV